MTHEVCEESGALAFLHRKPLILITAKGVIFLRQKARKKEEGLSPVQNIGITETPIYYPINPHNHSETPYVYQMHIIQIDKLCPASEALWAERDSVLRDVSCSVMELRLL